MPVYIFTVTSSEDQVTLKVGRTKSIEATCARINHLSKEIFVSSDDAGLEQYILRKFSKYISSGRKVFCMPSSIYQKYLELFKERINKLPHVDNDSDSSSTVTSRANTLRANTLVANTSIANTSIANRSESLSDTESDNELSDDLDRYQKHIIDIDNNLQAMCKLETRIMHKINTVRYNKIISDLSRVLSFMNKLHE